MFEISHTVEGEETRSRNISPATPCFRTSTKNSIR